MFDDVATGESRQTKRVGHPVDVDAGFLTYEFRVGGKGTAECPADVVGDGCADRLRAEDDVDPVFGLVDTGYEGEPVAGLLELIFNLVGDLGCTAKFELGRFSSRSPDLDHAFIITSGDPAAPVALFAGPDELDLFGLFEGNAVQISHDMDRGKRTIAARVYDTDIFLDLVNIFVEIDDTVDEVLTEFLFIDRNVRPDSGGFYRAAGRADDTFRTVRDIDPDGIFDPAFAAKLAVFRRSAAFGTESLCEAHYTPYIWAWGTPSISRQDSISRRPALIAISQTRLPIRFALHASARAARSSSSVALVSP